MTGKFENAKDPEDSEGDEGSRHLAEVGVRRRDEEVGMRRGGWGGGGEKKGLMEERVEKHGLEKGVRGGKVGLGFHCTLRKSLKIKLRELKQEKNCLNIILSALVLIWNPLNLKWQKNSFFFKFKYFVIFSGIFLGLFPLVTSKKCIVRRLGGEEVRRRIHLVVITHSEADIVGHDRYKVDHRHHWPGK